MIPLPDSVNTIGALRQTVTETLGEMQDQGLVEVGHKQILVKNRQGLQDLALGSRTAGIDGAGAPSPQRLCLVPDFTLPPAP